MRGLTVATLFVFSIFAAQLLRIQVGELLFVGQHGIGQHISHEVKNAEM